MKKLIIAASLFISLAHAADCNVIVGKMMPSMPAGMDTAENRVNLVKSCNAGVGLKQKGYPVEKIMDAVGADSPSIGARGWSYAFGSYAANVAMLRGYAGDE